MLNLKHKHMTQFEIDLEKTINVGGGVMPKAIWNLIISIRDCKLYSKGLKPHRYFKISDVKWYFGVSGSADKIAVQLEEILNRYKEQMANMS